MIDFKQITATNFRSFRELSLSFREGITLIRGENLDEEFASSNGSGKTSVFEAVLWAITGQTNGGGADSVINLAVGKDCTVTLDFEVDGKSATIRRARKDTSLGNALLFEVEGQDITANRVADTQAAINQFIGVDIAVLRSIILLNQNLTGKFTSLTSNGRVDLLESLQNASTWESMLENAKMAVKQLSGEAGELDSARSVLLGKLEANNSVLASANSELSALLGTHETDASLTSQKAQLEAAITKLGAKRATVMAEWESAMSVAREAKNRVAQASDAALPTEAERDELYALKSIEELINSAVCPTCGNKKEVTDKTLEELEWRKKRADVIRERHASARVSVDAAQAASADADEVVITLGRSLMEMDATRKELDADVSAVTARMVELAAKDDHIQSVKARVDASRKTVGALEHKIEALTSAIAELVSKRAYEEFWVRELGARGGLRPQLLLNDIEYINTRIKYYLSKVFSDMRVSLSLPDAASRAIDINIVHMGTPKHISLLSAGECRRVDLVIQFSILDLVSAKACGRANLLCLDEVFDGLDERGISDIVSLLDDIQTRTPCIYVVSHNKLLSSLLIEQVVVTKEGGFSKLTVIGD